MKVDAKEQNEKLQKKRESKLLGKPSKKGVVVLEKKIRSTPLPAD